MRMRMLSTSTYLRVVVPVNPYWAGVLLAGVSGSVVSTRPRFGTC